MKNIKIGMVALVATMLAACSSYNYYSVGSSSNVAKYHTFAWLPQANSTKDPRFNNDLADDKIKDQATAVLETKGLQLKAKNPDMLVRYTIMVDNKVRVHNEPVYAYNYGGFAPRFYRGGRAFYYGYRGPYQVYLGQDTYRVPYKEGTLILDLIDRKSHKVVWRGYGVGELGSPESAVNDLPKVVDGILAKLQLSKM